MEMRNGLDGLKALLGISETSALQPRQMKSGATPDAGALAGDHATVSSAGTEALQAAGDSGVRMEKVTAVQAALAAGTYRVGAEEVARKMVDSMLVDGQSMK